jgi:endo-1,4-beta-mannosidase
MLPEDAAKRAYAWCYADYDARLFARPPFDRAIRERSFGLVRADGSEKPAAAVIRSFAQRLERGDVPLGSVPNVLDVASDVYYAAPDAHFRRLYDRWLEARFKG